MTSASTTPRMRYGTGRERLMAAARGQLIETGGDLDVEEVAARAGASKSLIWRHFGNRAGLLEAIVQEFWDGYDDAVADAHLSPGADWAARERERLGRLVDFLLDHPLAPVVLGHVEGDASLHRAIKADRLRRHIRFAVRNIRRGQKAGEIDKSLDPDLVAAMIIGGVHQALTLALTESRRPGRQRLTNTVWQAVAAILHFPS
jgi:AcrR family transcriptional regulator